MALIIDTGPLYASLDRSDTHHEASRELLGSTQETLVIPAPVLVEVDWLIRARLHVGVFNALLDDIASGAYVIEDPAPQDYIRIREICDAYSDSDIGFVDAAVVAVAERFRETKIASIDRRHLGIVRPRHTQAFRLLPD